MAQVVVVMVVVGAGALVPSSWFGAHLSHPSRTSRACFSASNLCPKCVGVGQPHGTKRSILRVTALCADLGQNSCHGVCRARPLHPHLFPFAGPGNCLRLLCVVWPQAPVTDLHGGASFVLPTKRYLRQEFLLAPLLPFRITQGLAAIMVGIRSLIRFSFIALIALHQLLSGQEGVVQCFRFASRHSGRMAVGGRTHVSVARSDGAGPAFLLHFFL